MKGKHVVFAAPGVVEIESFDVPPPGRGEALIQTEVTLISPGTEGASLMARPNTSQEFPRGSGYSNVGRVLEVGEDVEGFEPGERVASRAAHASHVNVGIDRIAKVPESLSSDEATFFTLCAICLQGVRKARVELGESVLVVGQGVVGNLALQFARLQGGYPVIAADLSERRLEVSQQVGADRTIRVGEQDLVEATRAMTEGDGARVVIEATGSPGPVVSAFQAAGWRGRVVLLGSTRGETERVNFYRDVHKRGLTIIGAHLYVAPSRDSSPGFWPLATEVRLGLDLLAAGRVHVQPLITTRFPYKQSADAFKLVTQQQRDALGILIDWAGGR
jgi:2-desacetyl-2-hydroxyethyl bacteriochlorophyllide A dehydrogenase